MPLSRRQILSKLGLLASSAALPSFIAEALLAQASEPLIRYNITSNDSEATRALAAYRSAVGEMRNRQPHLPTSWQFQANIHSWPGQFGRTASDPEEEFRNVFGSNPTNEPLARKVWGTCTHGEPTVSFLPWHRLYLYFFERMIRSASGQPASSRLGLPYWDWTKDRALPLAFREAVNGSQQNNPLYWDIRRMNVTPQTNPLELFAGMASAEVISTMLGRRNFSARLDPSIPEDFNTALEGGPHGDVHVFVGVPPRGMGFFEEAGRDPIFWVHHCNIDRLWNHWANKPDHTNPLNARVPMNVPNSQRRPWSDVRHVFVDENGAEVSLTTSQVIAAAQILGRGYVYDDLQVVEVASNAAAPPPPAPSTPARSPQTLASSGPVEVAGGPSRTTLQPVAAAPLPPGTPPAAPPQDFIMVIRDIEAKSDAEPYYGVYVNLPPGLPAIPDSPYFVGRINIFNAQAAGVAKALPSGQTTHGAHGVDYPSLSLNEALRKQQWKVGDPVNITIVPIPLNNQLAAPGANVSAAPSPGPALRVGGIDIIGY